MKRLWLACLCALGFSGAAHAQTAQVLSGGCGTAGYSTTKGVAALTQDATGRECTNPTASTVVLAASITRPSNTTAYAAGQALCASTSVDCVAMSFTAGRRNSGSGLIIGAQLFKSGTGTTNASYTIELYQTTPTLTSIHDASTYSPSLADITSGAYRGYAACASPSANGDNVQFQCTLGPATAGGSAIGIVSDTTAKIYGVIQVNGAYTPISGEVFRVVLTEVQD